MAEIRFRKKDVVAKNEVSAVVFESPDKRIQVVAKPRWMKDKLLSENIKVFGKPGTVSLPIEKMLAFLANELIIHEGWDVMLRTSWGTGEQAADDVKQLYGNLRQALEQARDKKAIKKTAPLS